MSVGNGDVTVVEFFDYNCGYCRKTLPDVVKLIESEPNVKVQFLEYPDPRCRIRRTLHASPSPRRNKANISNSIRRC